MKKTLLSVVTMLSISGLSAQVLSEDFESGLPAGWTMDGGWAAGTADALASQYYAPTGTSNILCVNDDAADPGGAGAVVTSSIDLSSLTTALLTFDAYFVNGDYEGDETAKVYASTDGSSWDELADLEGSNEWQSVTVNLSSYVGGSVMLKFAYDDAGGWEYGFSIDNVVIDEAPAQYVVLEATTTSTQVMSAVGEELDFTFELSSLGSEDLAGYSFNYSINGGDVVAVSGNTLTIGGSEVFTISLAEGSYEVSIEVVDADGNVIASEEMTLAAVIPVPNFVMTDTDGETHDLHNLLSKGDVVVLDFFASWCGPCEVSTPEVNDVWVELGSGELNFQVFGVTVEATDDASVINGLNWGAEYPKFAYSDTNESLYQHYNALYGSGGIPLFIMICPNESNPGFSEVSWSSVGWAGPEALSSAASDCDASVSVEEVLEDKLTVFPNPASNNATVALNLTTDNDVVIEVVNALGQKVFVQSSTIKAGENLVELPVDALSTGLYYVNIKIANEMITEKLNIIK